MTQNQSTNRNKKLLIAAGLALGLGAFAVFNNLPHPSSAAGGGPLDEFALYGINSQSGSLVRYQFSNSTLSTVGTVSDGATTLTGIQASAYVPRNTNIFAFWRSPADGQTKLVYVNTNDATASVVGQDLGMGRITGAVAVKPTQGAVLQSNQQTPISEIAQHEVFAVQANTIDVEGLININPSSASDNEFELTRPDGSLITRDELKDNATVDAAGTYYQGAATSIIIRPKGSGNQDTLLVNGVNYAWNDDSRYVFTVTGNLTVRVYNPANGTPAGSWYLDLTGEDVVIQENAQPAGSLVKINANTGVSQNVMSLSRAYDGLAATTSQVFYGTFAGELYAIDPSTVTETLVGPLPYSEDVEGFEAAGTGFYGFAGTTNQFRAIDPATGSIIGADINTGATGLETLTFIRLVDEAGERRTFD